MQIQSCNNYNNSFGSKVITTSSASEIMNNYKPSKKNFMIQRITELENNGNKDVVLIDACRNVNDVFITVYKLINGKLCKGEYPSRFESTKKSFSWSYESASSNPIRVKNTGFNKYNPLWNIIEDLLKQMDNVK